MEAGHRGERKAGGRKQQNGTELAWSPAEDGNSLGVCWLAGREAWA